MTAVLPLTDAPSARVANWVSVAWHAVEHREDPLQLRITKVADVKSWWPGRFNRRPLKGLSRVRGNQHARFLGE